MQHLLKMLDLSGEEILNLLNMADQLKYEQKHHIPHPHLKGQSLGMIFQKSSTRTRVSFEVGMYQLGGQALFLSSNDLQIGRGEPVQDTARVLSRYLDGIMIRTYAQQEVEDLAQYGSIPIINGLTDFCHPCQVLADLMTVREYKGRLQGLKLCFIGDGNNMANSLTVGGLKTGMSVAVATPDNHKPDDAVLSFANSYPGQFLWTEDPLEAAPPMRMSSLPTFGPLWARKGKRRNAVNNSRANTRSTALSWRQQSRMPWYSTACPPIGKRRSPQKSLSSTLKRFSTRRKTAFMRKRPLCSP